MAPIELKNLSSNWKKLQKTLPPSSSKLQEKDAHESGLKRKRTGTTNGSHAQVRNHAVRSACWGNPGSISQAISNRLGSLLLHPA
jgi:uncharacterized membrane-anchored protein YhcB (DUF1043 family)